MTGLLLALVCGLGVHLLVTSRRGRALRDGRLPTRDLRSRLDDVGFAGVGIAELVAASVVVGVVAAAVTAAVFGGVVPALVVGVAAAATPAAAHRRRHDERMALARDAWPRLIEEIRLQTSSLGRSVPQALFEVGRRGPDELRPAFARAEREWRLTTDFARTVAVLKHELADASADATLETLLVAHDLGGTALDKRLEALADDRAADVHARRDARAHQAGVRFSRRFVVIVPAGMALVGLQIGDGRAAYRTPTGQLLVLAGIACVVLCWWWAGRMLVIPPEQRVLR